MFNRYHTVQEFNKGVYDYIIASDEGSGQERDSDQEGSDNEPSSDAPKRKHPASSSLVDVSPPRPRKRKRPQGLTDAEYGVSRGVDFVDVSCVINFDLPLSSRSYTHRIGRTARAGKTGMALSFVVPRNEWGKNKVVGCVESAKRDEQIFARIEREQGARGSQIKDYAFDMKQVEAFRYRMEDALRAVTRSAIKEARVKELKTEILNSDKLKVRCHVGVQDGPFPICNTSRPTLRTTPLILTTYDMTNRSIPHGYSPI